MPSSDITGDAISLAPWREELLGGILLAAALLWLLASVLLSLLLLGSRARFDMPL